MVLLNVGGNDAKAQTISSILRAIAVSVGTTNQDAAKFKRAAAQDTIDSVGSVGIFSTVYG